MKLPKALRFSGMKLESPREVLFLGSEIIEDLALSALRIAMGGFKLVLEWHLGAPVTQRSCSPINVERVCSGLIKLLENLGWRTLKERKSIDDRYNSRI